ncbi:MAG: hypothetical protein KBS83_06355 [Lachnospiraceae bacterium]|nr:hypothetical protein [Candidatus Equihabitans merdae]
MTAKERVMSALKFETVDKTPTFPMEGTGWVCKKHGISYDEMFALEDCGASLIVEAFKEMGSDIMFAGGEAWMGFTQAFGGSIDASEIGTPIIAGPCIDDKNGETPLYDCSYDELREKLLAAPIVQSALKQIREVKKLVGEEYPVSPGMAAPFTAASTMVSPKRFVKMVGKKSPNLPKLLELAATITAIMVDLETEAGADIIATPDPVGSGDMISMTTYNDIVAPAYKKFMETRKSETPIIMHICGNAGERVESVRDLGVSVFSVDSMVDMADMLKRADHKIVMMGSLSPAATLLQGTPDKVYEEATALLELAAANNGGFFLSTGCELPAPSPLENIQAMIKARDDFAARA